MKLAIIGSRGITSYDLVNSQFKKLLVDCPNISTIVSGGARGVDTIAEEVAKQHGLELTVFPADWKTYGKKAGFLRNTTIIEESDIVLAIWDGASRGTMDSVKKAKALGKPCRVVDLSQQLNTDILF